MWERHDYPFVWLLFHAELLIFSPSPNQDESINECARRRLQLLYAGHIASLWSEVLQVTSRLPGSAPPRPTSTNSVNKAAQAAADCDNFRTAYARATTVTPVATVRPTTLNDHVKPLYPLTIYVLRLLNPLTCDLHNFVKIHFQIKPPSANHLHFQ
jgi:hypothetical protein